MRRIATIILLAISLAVVVGCDAQSDEGAGGATGGGAEPVAGSAKDVAASEGGGGARAGALGDESAASVPTIGPQVVQTASVRLAVARGRFDDAVDEARSIADAFGGFVVSSSASQEGQQRLVRGTLVVRIPARSYTDAMKSFAALGRVEARNESGEDVSQEYVDLRARVRQLQAVEGQLLQLLDRANTVGAALAVQRELSQVQLDLERAQGRLQYLDDRVAFATISLAVHEQFSAAPSGDDRFSILDAWRKAGNGFLAVVGWIFVVVATTAPLLVFLILLWLLARSAARRNIGRIWPRLKSD